MKEFLSKIKRKIYNTINPPKSQLQIFNEGYKAFLETGKTSDETYMAFIGLYCSSNGKFNED